MNSNQIDCMQTLTVGLLLEDRGILLPWGARRGVLAQQGHPDAWTTTFTCDEMHWDGARMLAGLPVERLQVVLYPYGWLDTAWLWLDHGACPLAAGAAFDKALAHLTRALGEPSSTTPTPTCCSGEKTVTWQRGGMQVALFLRAGAQISDDPYCVMIHITREMTH